MPWNITYSSWRRERETIGWEVSPFLYSIYSAVPLPIRLLSLYTSRDTFWNEFEDASIRDTSPAKSIIGYVVFVEGLTKSNIRLPVLVTSSPSLRSMILLAAHMVDVSFLICMYTTPPCVAMSMTLPLIVTVSTYAPGSERISSIFAPT